jgi:exosome complex component RRP4
MNKEIEENNQEKEDTKKRKIVIPGEVIVKGKEFLPGDGTRKEDDEIIANRYGLAEISDRLIKIIPLSGKYIPRRGNTVIGKVLDITFNGWLLDIGSPYNSFLSVNQCSRYIDDNLSDYYDINDLIVCKVFSVKRKGIDLTIKSRGLGKLEDGLVIHVNSNKVPRIIGKEGSMINLIKKETGCDIIVGQNGIVWIKGDDLEKEIKAKEAILFIVEKSYVSGLTDKVNEFLEKNKK